MVVKAYAKCIYFFGFPGTAKDNAFGFILLIGGNELDSMKRGEYHVDRTETAIH